MYRVAIDEVDNFISITVLTEHDARGVGKDGVPAFEWQVGGDQQGAVLVAAADELEDQVASAQSPAGARA